MLLLSSVSIAEKMKDFGLGKILVTVHDPGLLETIAGAVGYQHHGKDRPQ